MNLKYFYRTQYTALSLSPSLAPRTSNLCEAAISDHKLRALTELCALPSERSGRRTERTAGGQNVRQQNVRQEDRTYGRRTERTAGGQNVRQEDRTYGRRTERTAGGQNVRQEDRTYGRSRPSSSPLSRLEVQQGDPRQSLRITRLAQGGRRGAERKTNVFYVCR